MKEKLQELLDRENLRPGQLAERLDVNPASISHILKGRNKPGIEFLQKILRAFPKLNPDWLLLDSAQYERDGATAPSAATSFGQNPGATAGRAGIGTAGLQQGVPGAQNGASSSAAHVASPHAAAGNPSLFGQPVNSGSTPTASGLHADVAIIPTGRPYRAKYRNLERDKIGRQRSKSGFQPPVNAKYGIS